MGIPFATTLDVVASLIHLKLEFHILQGDMVTINVDLEGVNRIYQALQRDWGEGNGNQRGLINRSAQRHEHPSPKTLGLRHLTLFFLSILTCEEEFFFSLVIALVKINTNKKKKSKLED